MSCPTEFWLPIECIDYIQNLWFLSKSCQMFLVAILSKNKLNIWAWNEIFSLLLMITPLATINTRPNWLTQNYIEPIIAPFMQKQPILTLKKDNSMIRPELWVIIVMTHNSDKVQFCKRVGRGFILPLWIYMNIPVLTRFIWSHHIYYDNSSKNDVLCSLLNHVQLNSVSFHK